jgi:putative Mg2+ transporter-C (MgtC) family protein
MRTGLPHIITARYLGVLFITFIKTGQVKTSKLGHKIYMQTLDYTSLFSNLTGDFFIQILVLLVCVGLIGLERQISKKPAGIRTSILIGLGSMLFVKYSIIAGHDNYAVNADPARVMGQVVTGIGFLGAGTIMNKKGLVAGLTTASSIWVEAALGAVVALGYYLDAIIFSLLCVFILQGVSKLEVWLRLSRTVKGEGRFREGVGKYIKEKE